MAVTFSIGGVSFSAMSSSDGRKAVACNVGNGEYRLIRFHGAGWTGNFVIRDGRTGGTIMCLLRYIGNAVESDYSSDRTAWENTAVTIVDEAGNSFENCNLLHMARSDRPKGIPGDRAFLDAVAVFTRD